LIVELSHDETAAAVATAFWQACRQAPNTSLVPVYDRITFFGNSKLGREPARRREGACSACKPRPDFEINREIARLIDLGAFERESKPSNLAPQVEISYLVRAYGDHTRSGEAAYR